jgi:ribosome-binding ATPase
VLGKSAKIIPTQLEFVDIAGLVKGASKGEGLGNQFLGNIRSTDAIIHVVRCFDDGDITHVMGSVEPLRDIEIIETELMIADLESIEKQFSNQEKKAKQGDKDAKVWLEVMAPVKQCLADGHPARLAKISAEEKEHAAFKQLLTSKPVLYACNVSEADAATGNAWTTQVAEFAKKRGEDSVIISAAIESEVAQLSSLEEKMEFLGSLGLTEPGLNKIIRAGQALLGIQTYFTVGPKEARAWNIRVGMKAPQAAGVIHTDFEKGFIRAETIAYDDFVACGGEQGAKDAGKMRQEGKEYVVHDGDIMLFRFNV